MGCSAAPLEPLQYEFGETYLPTPRDLFIGSFPSGEDSSASVCFADNTAGSYPAPHRPSPFVSKSLWVDLHCSYVVFHALDFIPSAFQGLTECSAAHRPKSCGAGTSMLRRRLHPYSFFPVPNTCLQNNKTDILLIFLLLGSSAVTEILRSSKVMLVGKDPS